MRVYFNRFFDFLKPQYLFLTTKVQSFGHKKCILAIDRAKMKAFCKEL